MYSSTGPIPQLAVRTENITSISLSLVDNEQNTLSGSINGGLIQYNAVPDGAHMGLLIENISSIGDITGLTELTNYSIRMAFLDADVLCVFSEPVFAKTGICINAHASY